jgi:hypothetical protein
MILFTRLMGHWLRKSLPWAERAFDNTSASIHGVCSTINRWIDFMLRSRSVFFNIRGVRLHNAYGCAIWLSTGVNYRPYSGFWNMVADNLLKSLGELHLFCAGHCR